MIEMKFYRDDEYVYINNPDGTTKRVAVEDFESAVSGEGGSGSSSTPFIVVCNSVEDTEHHATTYTLNKTWKEIHDAYLAGPVIVNEDDFAYCAILQCYGGEDDGFYGVTYYSSTGNMQLETTSEQGYPTFLST